MSSEKKLHFTIGQMESLLIAGRYYLERWPGSKIHAPLEVAVQKLEQSAPPRREATIKRQQRRRESQAIRDAAERLKQRIDNM